MLTSPGRPQFEKNDKLKKIDKPKDKHCNKLIKMLSAYIMSYVWDIK